MGICFNEKTKTFYLESKDISYVFSIGVEGFLLHNYFGKRIGKDDLSYDTFVYDRGHETLLPLEEDKHHSYSQYLNECPTYGRTDFRESMLAFNDYRGSRLSVLEYQKHEIYSNKKPLKGLPSVRGHETLEITLYDKYNFCEVKLFYTVYEDLPVIIRHTEIINLGDNPLMIDRAYSFSIDFPQKDKDVLSLYGTHLRERNMERSQVRHGVFTIDSKRGESSSVLNPFMALLDPSATEDYGEVIGFNLVYSGDFVFKTQMDVGNIIRVLGGINDYDFEWKLNPKETFVTPEVVIAYSHNGLGDMSRTFHDLYRDYLINPKKVKAKHPLVINNWEATYFWFDEEKLMSIMDSVKDSGIDTFVLDDGWFENRNNDLSGLGDWTIDYQKLPNGLKRIIDHAHKNNLKFGIWFEPEMVNKDSKVYQEHPDWIIGVSDIEPCPGRHQYYLDLSRKEVREYIVERVSNILKNNEIDYVKWDMNRPMTDNYSSVLKERSKELHHRYMLGLYEVLETLTSSFPNVFFEGCASGGCRFDPGMLYYFPQIWTSDNTDAYNRTLIQYGTSIPYPLSSQSCHVSVCPNHQTGRNSKFSSRADIAHLGSTGYELDTTKLSKEEIEEIKKQVNDYRRMEHLILEGDLYRLNNPNYENIFAFCIVSKDKNEAVITEFRRFYVPNGPVDRIYPKGLDDNKTYFIEELNVSLKGSTIMNVGLIIPFRQEDFDTNVWHLRVLN